MKWATAWQLIKDVALTGTGLLMIVLQVFAQHPSDLLLVTGLALTVPSATSHAVALLSEPSVDGDGQESSSSSSRRRGSPPSSSPPEQ